MTVARRRAYSTDRKRRTRPVTGLVLPAGGVLGLSLPRSGMRGAGLGPCEAPRPRAAAAASSKVSSGRFDPRRGRGSKPVFARIERRRYT